MPESIYLLVGQTARNLSHTRGYNRERLHGHSSSDDGTSSLLSERMSDLHDCFAHLRLAFPNTDVSTSNVYLLGADVTSWIFKTRVIRAREVEPPHRQSTCLPAYTRSRLNERSIEETPCLPSDPFYTITWVVCFCHRTTQSGVFKRTNLESFPSPVW